MKIYFAPLEGVTGYIFRNTYNTIYGSVDKFFSPFVAPSESCPLTPRERKDIAPENNRGIHLVPQILTCRSDHFIEAAREMRAMGYKEVNLNLGCPSGTVCAKGKGAGFLQDTSALRKFLDDIYSYSESESEGMKISIKTRLGYEQPDEFFALMDIFNEFPVSELIVHPRIRTDFYKGEPRRDYFAYALSHAKIPLVYNGNVFACEDYDDLSASFGARPDPVMLGRGLVTDPDLAGKMRRRFAAGSGAGRASEGVTEDGLAGGRRELGCEAASENGRHELGCEAASEGGRREFGCEAASENGRHELGCEAASENGRHEREAVPKTDLIKLRQLHDALYHEYQKVMAPDINVLHKMRELWSFWKANFDESFDRDIKRLLKAKKYAEYEAIADQILMTEAD